MAIFEWRQEYSVGVSGMDAHHQRMFDIMNKIYDSMKDGKAAEVLPKIMAELIDYTIYHFTEEEKNLERINYAGLAAQKAAHQQFIKKLADFKVQIDKGRGVFIATQVATEAVDWFKNHILTVDKLYEKDMNAHGIK